MPEIDSKLAFLLKENKIAELHTPAIVYKPFDIKKVIDTLEKVVDSQRNMNPIRINYRKRPSDLQTVLPTNCVVPSILEVNVLV